MRLRRQRDERVVGTSTPGAWCEPGTVYQWREGHPWYRITRVVQMAPSRDMYGNLHPYFEVRGVPADRPLPPDGLPQFHSVGVLELGDLGPGESVSVSLPARGWREIVRSDPNPMPRLRPFRWLPTSGENP